MPIQNPTRVRRWPLALAWAWLGGLLAAAVACPSGEAANPQHCFYAHGDATCAERFGGDRPYCASPDEPCEGATDYGCVAERPTASCHGVCGDGLTLAADPDCAAAADGEDGLDGTDDEVGEAICGDGAVEGDEACDDGNDVDDDECSDACVAASCGDGVVQAAVGEQCDDGNADDGDGCNADCQRPGVELWSRVLEQVGPCVGHDVVVGGDGGLRVAVECPGDSGRILGLDPTGELVWNVAGVAFGDNLALLPGDAVVSGGELNGTSGHLRRWDADGGYEWHLYLEVGSFVDDVAVDPGGRIVAAGDLDGAIMTYAVTAAGVLEWTHQGASAGRALALALDGDGRAWVVRGNPLGVDTVSAAGETGWTSSAVVGSSNYAAVAIDGQGRGYVVTQTNASWTSYALTKLDADGAALWSVTHDQPGRDEAGYAVAVLPGGGALVAGYVDGLGGERDGLLSWYSPDGELVHEALYDGPAEADVDSLRAVHLTPAGTALLVGEHRVGGTPLVWLLEVSS